MSPTHACVDSHLNTHSHRVQDAAPLDSQLHEQPEGEENRENRGKVEKDEERCSREEGR